jgi:hypothetical protein
MRMAVSVAEMTASKSRSAKYRATGRMGSTRRKNLNCKGAGQPSIMRRISGLISKEIFQSPFTFWGAAFECQSLVEGSDHTTLHVNGEAAAFAGSLHSLVGHGLSAGVDEVMIMQICASHDGIKGLRAKITLNGWVFGCGHVE